MVPILALGKHLDNFSELNQDHQIPNSSDLESILESHLKIPGDVEDMNQTKIRKFSIGNNLKEVQFKDLHFTKKVQAGGKFMTKADKKSLGPNKIKKFSNSPSHMDHKATLALILNKEDHEDMPGEVNQDSSRLLLTVPDLGSILESHLKKEAL